jgi:hypothetical protein
MRRAATVRQPIERGAGDPSMLRVALTWGCPGVRRTQVFVSIRSPSCVPRRVGGGPPTL